MATDIDANLTPPRSPKHALCRLPLFIVAVFLVLITSAPAFGQMGNSVTYSDSWVDDSSNPAYVIGSGVTSDSYNSYGHRYWVTTTLTSPSGRTASGTSYTSGSYARMDVSLTLDFETGDFTTTTNHSMSCPYMYGTIVTTTTIFKITLTRSCYLGVGVDEQGKCIFEPGCAAGTTATCQLPQPHGIPVGTTCAETYGKYFWCLDVSYNDHCVKYVTVCVGPYTLPQPCT